MSQALYRQYRPQRFADVVGQEVAVRTLRNAIEQDRVAHAYLFTGTKGTGKTTLAKLLAKAMNCEGGPTTDPCGTCESCVAIAEGRSMDVAEIDAASNTGIDHVREKIIDTVSFQPSRGARRVYIIDEAHQLSKAAFNALLKTIEEPPAHVLFVFCTTETHLMMATVRDRCQRITMRSPGAETLVDVLQRVCAQEGIEADVPALRAVARAAQGSFRNALGTLEMLTTTFGTSFSREAVLQHLGVVSEETLFEATDAVLQGNAGDALRLVDRLVQEGVDLDQFARSLAEHLRGVLLELHGVGEAAGVGDPARLTAQAAGVDERRVLASIDCIADAATRIRVGSDARISLETALVRAAQGLGLPLLAVRLAAIEQKLEGGYGLPIAAPGGAAPAAGAPAAPARAAAPAPPRPATPAAAPAAMAPAPVSTPAPAAPAAVAPAAPAPAASASASAAPTAAAVEPFTPAQLADTASWWTRVVQQVAQTPAHRPVLGALSVESADASRVALRLATRLPVSPKLKEQLGDAIRATIGHPVNLEVLPPAVAPAPAAAPAVASTPAAPAASPAAQAPARPVAPTAPATPTPTPAAAPLTDDAGVANVMSMFDAVPVTAAGRDED